MVQSKTAPRSMRSRYGLRNDSRPHALPPGRRRAPREQWCASRSSRSLKTSSKMPGSSMARCVAGGLTPGGHAVGGVGRGGGGLRRGMMARCAHGIAARRVSSKVEHWPLSSAGSSASGTGTTRSAHSASRRRAAGEAAVKASRRSAPRSAASASEHATRRASKEVAETVRLPPATICVGPCPTRSGRVSGAHTRTKLSAR